MVPHRREHLDGLAAAILLACCMFWGFQQVLVKATLPELPPVYQAALRFAGATVLLLLWCRWRGVPLFQRDGSLWPGLLAGGLFATEFACLYIGVRSTKRIAQLERRLVVGFVSSTMYGALPLLVRAERLRALQWTGLVLAFVALVFALRESFVAPLAQGQLFGDALALFGGLAWGLTTVTIRASSLSRSSAEKLLFYQVAVSAVALPALSLGLGETWTLRFSAFALGSLLLQTVVGAFASYLVWMWMLGRYPATRISAFAFLTPMFALLFGALWLREPLTKAAVEKQAGR